MILLATSLALLVLFAALLVLLISFIALPSTLLSLQIRIDNFVLIETTEPLTTCLNELNASNKQLLKIVYFLSKENKPKQKGLLFYIYSDGTVEKKLIIE